MSFPRAKHRRFNDKSAIPVKKALTNDSSTSILTTSKMSSGNTTSDRGSKRTLELDFFTKKKRFAIMKKELIERQKPVIDMYNAMLTLKKKVATQNGKDLPIDDLRVIDCADYLTKCASSMHKKTDGGGEKLSSARLVPVDTNAIQTIEKKLKDIPRILMELYRDFKNKLETPASTSAQTITVNDDGTREMVKEGSESLQQYLDELIQTQNTKVAELLDYIKSSVKPGPSVTTVNSANEELEKKVKRYERIIGDLQAKLNAKTAELEPDQGEHSEESFRYVKCKLAEAKIKIKMDDDKIEQLQSIIKKLEIQIKNMDSVYDRRTKELVKKCKLNDALVVKAENERGVLRLRVQDLEELLSTREHEFDKTVMTLKNKFEASEKTANNYKIEIEQFEKKYNVTRDKFVRLDLKHHQVLEMAQKNQPISGALVGSTAHTQTENDLWTELQNTRLALSAAEDKLNKRNEDIAIFMKNMNKAANLYANNKTPQFLAYQLAQKDEIIDTLNAEADKYSDFLTMSKDIAEKQENEIRILKKQIEEFKIEADINKKEISECNVLIHETQNKLDISLMRNDNLEHQVLQKDRLLTAAQSKIKDLESLLKVRESVIGLIKSKKDLLTTSEVQKLKEYVSEISRQNTEVRAQLSEKCVEVKKLEGSLEIQTNCVQRLERTIKTMEKLCQDSNEQIIGLTAEVKHLHKALDESKKQLEQYIFASPPTASRHAIVRYPS